MIDVKELHIGAHVMHKGKRYRVAVVYGELVGLIVGKDEKNGESVVGIPSDEIEPIPLTAELLQELRFEKVEHGVISFWNKDNLYMQIRGGRMELSIDCERIMCGYNVRYLHELEDFVYLTTKQELIKED